MMPRTTAGGPEAHRRAVLLSRAKDLVPMLASRLSRAEKARRVLADTWEDLRKTELLRMLQPARIGGGELDYGMLLDASALLAQGCPSTAWVFANVASHHWMLAMFPAAAQNDVWDKDRDALISASFIFPAGRAHPAEGGFLVSGRWPFCAGVSDSSWTMVGAIVRGDDDGESVSEYRVFLLPQADYRVADVWQSGGLEAADANDLEAD